MRSASTSAISRKNGAHCVAPVSIGAYGAIIWQAQVIADQRAAIKWLESLKFGS